MTGYVSAERRTAKSRDMLELFNAAGWFDKQPEIGKYVALSLEFNSPAGITANILYIAALYVEQYTDDDVLRDLDTADIMTIIDRECTTVFTVSDYS